MFAVYDCGFVARCTLEDCDASRIRVDKIYDLISESKYGIHDISRVTLDHVHRLPRFNMPLELGLWLGAKRFGSKRDKQKRALVLDKLPHRYQIFCSDIAGQDATFHRNDTAIVIRRIRDWLRNSPDYKNVAFPGADTLVADAPSGASGETVSWRSSAWSRRSALRCASSDGADRPPPPRHPVNAGSSRNAAVPRPSGSVGHRRKQCVRTVMSWERPR